MGGCCTKGGQTTSDVNTTRTKNSEKDHLMATDSNYSSGSASTPGTEASSYGSDAEMDELHRIEPAELGRFVLKKMNNKTLDRLWKHLDEHNSGQIERTEVLNILQWMSVLYVAFRFRQQGGQGQPQINKRKLKAQFVPVKDWILENKMNTKNVVTREEFRKTFGAWLKEYSEVH